MSFIFVIRDGKLSAGSEYNKARLSKYLSDNEGAVLRLEPIAKGVSDQLRGYVFGAVIPMLRNLVVEWREMDENKIYEILKREFNGFVAYNPVTKKEEKYGQSALSKSIKNKSAMEFVARVGDWVEENYNQRLPDPEEYKKWRDSAPMKSNKL